MTDELETTDTTKTQAEAEVKPEAQAEVEPEVEASPPKATATPTAGGGSSSRRVLAAVFWLLASLSILLSGVTLWAHQTLLTSNGWSGIVSEVVADPEVIDEISSTLVTRISDSLDVRDSVAGFLPGSLDIVAGVLTSNVEDRIADLVADFAATDTFQDAFVAANVVAHDAAIKAIRGGDSEVLTSEEGLITLNIFPLIEGVLLQLQDAGLIDDSRDIPDLTGFEPNADRVQTLERILGRDLPDDIGVITIIDSENLGVVQQVVRYFDLITIIFLLLAVLFVGLALWLSSSRVRMVLWLAGGGIAALAIGRFFTRLILNRITDRAQEGDASVTVLAIIDTAVDSLMWFTFILMAVAVLIALLAVWWERHKTGERAARETPPRTLGHWARDNARLILYVGIGVIAFIVLWDVGGPDIALLAAAAVGLLAVAVKVLTDSGDDEAPAAPESDSA